jgi:hypothetical protein
MSASVMNEPSHEPLGRAAISAVEEDKGEEDQDKEKVDEEELKDETRGGDERTEDGRAPVLPELRRDGCGLGEDASLI